MTHNRTVLIDATCVENIFCGYRIYAEELLRELLPLLPGHGFAATLLVRRDLSPDHPLLALAASFAVPTVAVELPVLGLRRMLLNRRAAGKKFDAYFCLHSNPLPAPPAPRRLATLHDLTALRLPGYFDKHGWLKRHWLRFEYRFLLGRMDRVLAVSSSTRDDAVALLGLNPAKLGVTLEAGRPLPGGDAWPDGIPDGVPFFLSLGSRPHKNIQRTVEAFCRFAALTDAPYHLVVVGKGAAEKARLAGQFPPGTLARVIEIGAAGPEQLASLYRHCFALLYASLYEGFGLPIAEAMGLGKPVITSNRSSMPEVAGDAALLVDPENVDAIVAAMVELASPEGPYRELAAKAAARSRQLSWGRTARETLAALESLFT